MEISSERKVWKEERKLGSGEIEEDIERGKVKKK